MNGEANSMSDKIVLIDGNSIMNRAFYGIPDLTNAKGMHTNAVYGFLNIMFRIINEESPKYLVVAFDVHKPTFRHATSAERADATYSQGVGSNEYSGGGKGGL